MTKQKKSTLEAMADLKAAIEELFYQLFLTIGINIRDPETRAHFKKQADFHLKLIYFYMFIYYAVVVFLITREAFRT